MKEFAHHIVYINHSDFVFKKRIKKKDKTDENSSLVLEFVGVGYDHSHYFYLHPMP